MFVRQEVVLLPREDRTREMSSGVPLVYIWHSGGGGGGLVVKRRCGFEMKVPGLLLWAKALEIVHSYLVLSSSQVLTLHNLMATTSTHAPVIVCIRKQ